jgi:hypothetical protein
MYKLRNCPSPKFGFTLTRKSKFRPSLKGRVKCVHPPALIVTILALLLLTNIKTVAIISAVGDTLMFEHVGASPFEWAGPPQTKFLEISDWGIDDLVTREASDVLSKRFSVKPVTFEEANFDTWTWETLTRNIHELPLPVDDIDAYVVILRDWRGDEIGHSVHQVAGLGLYRRDDPPSERLGIFASCRIAIVDAHTYEILASRPVLTAQDRLPWTAAAPSFWPKTQNDLTDAQTAKLRSALNTLIKNTLAPTLTGLISVNVAPH